MKKELFLSLCEGRHEIPQAVDGSIFPAEIQNVADTADLESRAFSGIWRAAYCRYKSGESGYLYNPDDADLYELALCPGLRINLYATGLTVALVKAAFIFRTEQRQNEALRRQCFFFIQRHSENGKIIPK